MIFRDSFTRIDRKKRSKSTDLRLESLEDRRLLVVGPALPTGVGNGFDGVVEIVNNFDGSVCSGVLVDSHRHILSAAGCFDTDSDRQVDNAPGADDFTVNFVVDGGGSAADFSFQVSSDDVQLPSTWLGIEIGGSDVAVAELPALAPFRAEASGIFRSTTQIGRQFTVVGFGDSGDGTDGAQGNAGVRRSGVNRYDGSGSILNAPTSPVRNDFRGVITSILVSDFDNGTTIDTGSLFLGSNNQGQNESFEAPNDRGAPGFLEVDGEQLVASVMSYQYDRSDGFTTDSSSTEQSNFGEVTVSTRLSNFTAFIDGALAQPYHLTVDLDLQVEGNDGIDDLTEVEVIDGELVVSVNGRVVYTEDDISLVRSITIEGSDDNDEIIVHEINAPDGPTNIRLVGDDGQDFFRVMPSQTATIDVEGDQPTDLPGDALQLNLSRVSNPSVDNAPDGTATSASHQTVEFQNIETVIGGDFLEDNDTLQTASFLGSEPTVTLNNLSIHTEDDVDYLQIVVHDTGRMIVSRGDADVQLELLDSSGDVIGTLLEQADGSLIFPTVSQQVYFIRATSSSLVNYELEFENFPAPVPTGIHLDPQSDTGMMNNDGVTNNTQPRVFVEVDLTDFSSSGIQILQPQSDDSTTLDHPGLDGVLGTADDIPSGPGIAVQVKVTDSTTAANVIGFARRVQGSQTLFEFSTISDGITLSEEAHFVSAQVVVFDGRVENGVPTPSFGRTQLSEPLWITVDTTAPTIVGPPALATFSDSGMFSTDRVTSKMPIAFTGRLADFGDQNLEDDGIKVRIYANGEQIAGGVTSQGGNWEVTSEPLVDDIYVITAQFEDMAGNIIEWIPDQDYLVEVDTVAPNTPLLELTDESDSGHPNDGLTNDNTPTFSMTTEDAGLDVHTQRDNFKYRIWDRYENEQEFLLYDSTQDTELDSQSTPFDMFTAALTNLEQLPSVGDLDFGELVGAITDDGTLADGVHHLKLEVEDRAGNISHDFLYDLTIDTTVPDANISLNAGSDAGMFSNDNVTNINSVSLTGVSEVDAHVTVTAQQIDADGNAIGDPIQIGDTRVGSDLTAGAPNDGQGTWQVTTQPLADGLYQFSATIEDWAGNSSTTDGTFTIEVDTVAPNTPLLSLLESSDTGHLGDGMTSDGTPTVSITTEDAGDANHLFSDNIKYRIWDRFGDQQEFLIYDSTLNEALDGTLTPDDMFTASLLVQPNLPDDAATALGELLGAINQDGSLADGTHHLKLEVEDRAGNISNDFLFDLTIDTVVPTTDLSLSAGSDSGMFDDDNVTNIQQPSLTGVSEVDAQVTVFAQRIDQDGNPVGDRIIVGETQVGSDATDGQPGDGQGTWEVTSQPLADGLYEFSAQVEDWSGNLSTTDGDFRIEIDTIQPNTPLLELLTADDLGHPNDGRTADNLPAVSMTTGDAGNGVHLFTDNLKYRIYDRFQNQEEFLLYDSSTDQGLDALSTPGDMFTNSLVNSEQLPSSAAILIGQSLGAITQDGTLSDGLHSLKLEVEDRAGNISQDFLYDLTIDTSVPDSSLTMLNISDAGMFDDDNVTNINTPTFNGESESESHVSLFAQEIDGSGNLIGDRFLIGTATVGSDASNNVDDGMGLWEITAPTMADGLYRFSVEVEDWAGNRGVTDNALTIEIDTVAPNTPQLDLVDTADTGHSNDQLTLDNTPAVSMTTTDEGITNHLFADNFKFRIYDRYESTQEFLIYDSSVDVALDGMSFDGDGFTSALVNVEQLPSSAALDIGQAIGAITDNGELSDGVHHLKLEVEDRAGNISQDFLFDLTIDSVSPLATTIDMIDSSDSGMFFDDNVTSINAPAFSGVSEVDAQVTLYARRVDETGTPLGERFQIGETRVGSDSTNEDPGNPNDDANLTDGLGIWEITSEPLDDGLYQVTVQVEDWAANRSFADDLLTIEIDTEAPNTPLLNIFAEDDGGHAGDGLTSDPTPRVSMTTDDAGITTHLFSDNFKFRIFDRYENSQEFLIYDSSVDTELDALSEDGDGFTSELINVESLPTTGAIGIGQLLGAITDDGELADGVHHLKLEVEDRAGNISNDFLYDLTIDTTIPPVTLDMIDSSDSGMFNDDNVTDIDQPAFSGEAEIDAHVTLFAQRVDEDGNSIGGRFQIGTGTVGSDITNDDPIDPTDDANQNDGLGLWEITSEPLRDGIYEIDVLVEDWAGNRTVNASNLTIEVDTEAPNTPLLSLALTSDTGHIGDGLTSVVSPTVSMTTHDAGGPDHLFQDNFKFRIWDRFNDDQEVLIYDSSTDGDLDAISVDGDGFTSATLHLEQLEQLAEGTHHLKLEVEDRAGNISQDFLYDLIVDATIPTTSIDLIDSSDTGMFIDDNVTSERQIAVTGESEVDAHVILFAQRIDEAGLPIGQRFQVGETRVGSEASNEDPNNPNDDANLQDGLGLWEITSEPMQDGVYRLTATVEDWAGNRTVSQPLDIEIDGTKPNTPLLELLLSDDSGHRRDGLTNDNTPQVSMTTHDTNPTGFHLFEDNLKFRIFDRYENGREFLIYDSTLDDALDAETNSGDMLTSAAFHTELLPSASSVITGQVIGAITQDGALADGIHNLKLEVEDRAGNISEDFLYNLTIDTVVPTTDVDLIDSSDSGMFNDDNVTDIDQPAFSGVSEVDAHVTLYAQRIDESGDIVGSRFQIGEGQVGADSTAGQVERSTWHLGDYFRTAGGWYLLHHSTD